MGHVGNFRFLLVFAELVEDSFFTRNESKPTLPDFFFELLLTDFLCLDTSDLAPTALVGSDTVVDLEDCCVLKYDVKVLPLDETLAF